MSDFWAKVDKTLRYHAGQFIRGVRAQWWDVRKFPARRPIFVVGCSRAGTTLVYKTLSESQEIGTLQKETHDFWAALHPLEDKGWDTHALTAKDASQRDINIVNRYFYTQTGKQRFVDKNNQNGLCVSYLNALYPDAMFVYVKRSPGDNINSLIEGWGKADQFATWSGELPAWVAIDEGRYKRWCFFLAEGWRDYLESPIEEVCAFQYRIMNQAIIDARNDIPRARWVEVFYEDLVKDPVAAFEQLFNACDLTYTDIVRQHCENVLSRPYNAFSEIRLEKWRDGPNRERIERVLPSVASVSAAMGYAS